MYAYMYVYTIYMYACVHTCMYVFLSWILSGRRELS